MIDLNDTKRSEEDQKTFRFIAAWDSLSHKIDSLVGICTYLNEKIRHLPPSTLGDSLGREYNREVRTRLAILWELQANRHALLQKEDARMGKKKS
ncbi:MAG: hypothetical protein WDN09_02975 [bacterium]